MSGREENELARVMKERDMGKGGKRRNGKESEGWRKGEGRKRRGGEKWLYEFLTGFKIKTC